MIRIENLSVNYGNHRVLKGINTTFQPGTIYGIAGLNGAGKTTFFNVLSNVVKPTEGKISFNDPGSASENVCYLETTNFFYSRITGNEYLKIFKQTNAGFSLEGLQQYFKLPLDEMIETYSTGMKKKLALLAALKKDKDVYLLDEPFNGLDLETNKILELIITSLKKKGKTILVSSHIIDPLLTIADEIRLLENGSFTKTFSRDQFDKVEEELFGKLLEQANEVVMNSI